MSDTRATNEEKATTPLWTLSIPVAGSKVTLDITAGRPAFIVGRNGTGKSALVAMLARNPPPRVSFFPGSRTSFFEGQSLKMTPASRMEFEKNSSYFNTRPEVRYRPQSNSERNEKSVHDLLAFETKFKINAADKIAKEGRDSSAVTLLQENKSPIDRANAIFAQANLAVRLKYEGTELMAVRDNSEYSFVKMSDGERSSLIFIADVVAAESGAVFLIDEPELHLHPSIVVSLIGGLIAERPDCGFVVCTHQLDLPASSYEKDVLVIRGCNWVDSEAVSWEVETLSENSKIPEDLWVDVMGARSKILYIEGNETSSLDHSLYSLLYPSASIRPRENCKEVTNAVEGLRAEETAHRIEAFGIIDGDGMSKEQIEKLEEKYVFPLSVYSVESLLYSSEVINSVASQQSSTFGENSEIMLEAAKTGVLAALSNDDVRARLASRIAERKMRDQLFANMPSREDLVKGTPKLSVEFSSSFPNELNIINQLYNNGNTSHIIDRYPVRETGVLGAVAKALKFATRKDYERAALTRIQIDKTLKKALKDKLGKVSTYLAQ